MYSKSVLHLLFAAFLESVALVALHQERWLLDFVDLHEFLARVWDVVLFGLAVFQPRVEFFHLRELVNNILYLVHIHLSSLGDLLPVFLFH